MAATASWSRSTWTDAGQLANLIDPDADSSEAVGQTPPAWFARLVGRGDLTEACEFLAHALPRYECVVWAAQALLETGAVDRADPAVVAILRWIDNPDDATRRAAGAAADAVRNASAPKLLANAVFFSGGSIAPPDLAVAAQRAMLDIGERMAAGA